MWRPAREDRMPVCRYETARVEVRGRVTAAQVKPLLLEHVTIYADGWACWSEDGHVRRRCPGRPLL